MDSVSVRFTEGPLDIFVRKAFCCRSRAQDGRVSVLNLLSARNPWDVKCGAFTAIAMRSC